MLTVIKPSPDRVMAQPNTLKIMKTRETIYRGLEYEVRDVEYDKPYEEDYLTPHCDLEVTSYGSVFYNGNDVTDVFESLVDETDFLTHLEQEIKDELLESRLYPDD